jgi:hypothetical protein
MKPGLTRRIDQGLSDSILVGLFTAILTYVALALMPAIGIENIIQCCSGAVCVFVVMIGMIAFHRPQSPTRFDCHLCSSGFLLLFVVHVVVFHAVWIWRRLL